MRDRIRKCVRSLPITGWVLALLGAGLFGAVSPAHAKAGYSALVVDAESGRVLFSRGAGAKRYPASLTKIMTLYAIFDALDRGEVRLDTPLRVSKAAAGQPPSKLGLRPGQTIRVEDAILALVTRSANDVASVVAENLAASETAFARRMTKQARALGMSKTTFRNASGLPNRAQVTTAEDMAKLARAMLDRFPDYYPYFSTKEFRFGKRVHRNHNALLRTYAGTDGIKTGYIRASGYNLVASAERDGKRLIGVVFGGRSSKSRDAHMRTILDKSFARVVGRSVTAASTKRISTELTAGRPRPRKSSWKVQVGAFSRFATAEKQAQRAKSAAAEFLDRARVAVVQSSLNGKTIYRAHLHGLKRSQAGAACSALRRAKIDCIALPPSSS